MKKIVLISSVLSAFFATGCQAETVTSAATVQDKPIHTISFKDIQNHWAEKSIKTAIDKKYVDGYEDRTFRPEENVSRAEFIKMVVAATKIKVSSAAPGDAWYQPYFNAAITANILRTTDFEGKDVTGPITRLEMATISLRATDKTLQNNAMQMDDDSIMYNTAKTGLIQGMSNGDLAPKDSTTRAQSVTIIERVLTVNNGGSLEIDKIAIGQAELKMKNTNIFAMIPIFGGKQNTDDHFNLTPYNPSKLVMETPDGKYKGVVDQIVAIDMDNPKDPNRSLVGDITGLKWTAPGVRKSDLFVSDLSNYYIIKVKTHVEFNKDMSLYSGEPRIVINGFESPDTVSLQAGVLNTLGRTFYKIAGDSTILVLPKSGFSTDGSIMINIYAPAIPPQSDYSRTVVDIAAPVGE